ncbi:MAG: hypothetical protein GY861_28270 [bacterium]|nr:hypothetical protein [bacterium]
MSAPKRKSTEMKKPDSLSINDQVVVGVGSNTELAKDLKKRYSDTNFLFDDVNYGIIGINSVDDWYDTKISDS